MNGAALLGSIRVKNAARNRGSAARTGDRAARFGGNVPEKPAVSDDRIAPAVLDGRAEADRTVVAEHAAGNCRRGIDVPDGAIGIVVEHTILKKRLSVGIIP